MNVALEWRLANKGVNDFRAVPIAAAEHQVPVAIRLRFEPVERLDQAHMILGRMFQTRDVEEERLAQAVALSESSGLFGGAREKTVLIQPVVNHRQPFFRQSKKFENVAPGALADRDDFVLTTRQSPRDDASVEHPLPLVLVGQSERGEIMDRGHQRAGPRPEHSPIARHVQHLELMLARQTRKHQLVPEDVVHRRTEPFRHRHQLHLRFDKREERQILLQHKQSEPMPRGIGHQGAQQSEDVLRHAAAPALDDGGGQTDVHDSSSRRTDSSFDRRRTFRTAGDAPAKRTQAPRRGAYFFARIITPMPLLSMNRTCERSTIHCLRHELMELISARVCRQTFAAFAAVISPCEISGRLAPLITCADCSRSRALISSRASITSVAISKMSSTRICASARRTAAPGASRINCRPAMHIRFCSRTSTATPVLSMNFTLPNSSKQWRSSVLRRSHTPASRRIDLASKRSDV